MSIKEEILKLLREDPDFRRELSNILGLTALNQLKEATEQLSKIVVQSRDLAIRLEGVVERLAQRVDQLAVKVDQLAEAQRKTEERLKLLGEAQRKLEEFLLATRKEFSDRFDRLENKIGILDKTIGSLGQRWGVSYEELIREFFKEIVESEGINLEFINKFTYKDQDGNFGVKGTRYEVDIYAKDDKVYLMEVKSFAEADDVEWFNTKCDVLTRVLGLKSPIKLFLAVSASEDAVESSKVHGVRLVYGNLVEMPKRSKE